MPLPLTGAGPGALGAAGGAPTVAPDLYLIEANVGSYTATFWWTASNRTDTPGFRYEVWYQLNGGTWTLLDDTTDLSLTHSFDATPATYTFQIRPKNDAGEGPSSNTRDKVLPGEL